MKCLTDKLAVSVFKCCLIIMSYGKKKSFSDRFYNECINIIVHKNIFSSRKILFDIDSI